MKYARFRLPGIAVLLATSLCGCSDRTLDFRNAGIVNGKIYVKDANSSFSGKLTNVPITTITGSQSGYSKIRQVIEAASIYAEQPDQPVAMTHLGISMRLLCDAHVKDGLLDGETYCMKPLSDTVIVRMSFSGGALDGPFRFYDDSGKTIESDAAFKAGNPDGTQKVYSPDSGNLLLSVPWSGGAMSGTEKGYYGVTGKQSYESHWNTDGALDGQLSEWSPDGTLIHRLTYANGQKNGVEEFFYPDTGKPKSHVEWKDDHLDGLSETYDEDGKVLASQHFAAGKRVYSPEEAQAIATRHAQATYDGCMKRTWPPQPGVAASASDDEKTRMDNLCRQEAQQVKDAYFKDPGTSSVVVTIPSAGIAATNPSFSEGPTFVPASAVEAGSASEAQARGSDACVARLATTYQNQRTAHGLDTGISNDQMEEWRQRCARGEY